MHSEENIIFVCILFKSI